MADSNTQMFGYTPSQGVVEAPVVKVNQISKLAGLAKGIGDVLRARERSLQAQKTGEEDDRYWNARNKYNSNVKQYYDLLSSSNDVNVHAQALQQLHMDSLNLSKDFNLGNKHTALLDKTINDFTFNQRSSISGKIDTIETNTRVNNAISSIPPMIGDSPSIITENLTMLRNGISQTGKMESPDINKLLSSGYINSTKLKFDPRNTSMEQIKTIREETEKVLTTFDPTFISSTEYVAFQNQLNMAEEGIKVDIKRQITAGSNDPGVGYTELKKSIEAYPNLYSKEEVSNILNRKKVTQVETRVAMGINNSIVSGDNALLLQMNKSNPGVVRNGIKGIIGANVDVWKKYSDLGIQVGNVKEIDESIKAINSPGAIQSVDDLNLWKTQYDRAMANGYPIKGNLHRDAIVMNILYKRNPETATSDYQTLKRNPREVTDAEVDKFWKNKILNAEITSTRWDIDKKSGALIRDSVRPLVKALMAGGLEKGDIIDDVDDYLDANFMTVGRTLPTFDQILVPKTAMFNTSDHYDNVTEAYGADNVIPLDPTQPEGKWKIIRDDQAPEIIDYDELIYSSKGFGKPKDEKTPKPTRNKPLSTTQSEAKQTDIKDMISTISTDLGYTTNEIVGVLAVADIESNMGTNPKAYDKSRSYRGLFQIGKPLLSDVNKANGTNYTMNDLESDYTSTQIYLKHLYPMYKKRYNKLVPPNMRRIEAELTPLDTYLIHQQGQGGFRAIMNNLDMPISTFKTKYKDIYNNMKNNYYGKNDMKYVRDFTNDWRTKQDKRFQKSLSLIK